MSKPYAECLRDGPLEYDCDDCGRMFCWPNENRHFVWRNGSEIVICDHCFRKAGERSEEAAKIAAQDRKIQELQRQIDLLKK